jgi:hypothetical protein
MNLRPWPVLLVSSFLLISGCATYDRHGLDPERVRQIELSSVRQSFAFSRELEQQILALDPEHVTDQDIRSVLSQTPAPRIINIHGGIYPVHRRMISFSEFLIGMGYPGRSLTNPGDGTYTFSCYESSRKIAGAIAWYYEHEGLRPMIFGHSQGGMQTVKVLDQLAGDWTRNLPVFNPLTWTTENRYVITDPLTGKPQPVVGLRLAYASSVGAGGLTRILPNQWDMCMKLRRIPNSVDEFTGFCKQKDLLGGDYLGYGKANYFRPKDKAVVRNVWLPSAYKHGAIPDTKHLLSSQQIMNWINNYHPTDQSIDNPKLDTKFDANSTHILWAAEVWFSIKKHWVLELQRRIRARPASEGTPVNLGP